MAPAANCHWKPRGLSEDMLLALLFETSIGEHLVVNWAAGRRLLFIILVKLRSRTTGDWDLEDGDPPDQGL
ncbi:hypothetical protein RRF57_001881 [Xylaria bambusicola]|uniref:Uncharacterized protein n=1 Tax=Xylaria bambusicola TaxID=326684 RepID=A0AAN7Z6I4_9PEZI